MTPENSSSIKERISKIDQQIEEYKKCIEALEKEKISQVNFKMPEKDKKEVTAIFKYYGLDLSTGIKMYLKEVQHTKSIPLTLKPVTELDRAIAEADRGDFAGEFDSLEDFNKAFDKEIKNEN